MFADETSAVGGDEIREEGGVAYAAYSDGYDGGFDRTAGDYAHYMSQVRLEGARTLSGLLRRLGDRGHPVTCAVYTLLMPWVAGVARAYGVAVVAFRELIDALDGDSEKPPTYVLANTFDAMEPDALASLRPHVEVVSVGPVLSFLHDGHEGNSPNDLFDHDGEGYLHWLDTKPAKSVVYISFGSTSVMSKTQVAEIADAMSQSNRPFLWVLRKDNCRDKDEGDAIKGLLATASAATYDDDDDDAGGMVVEWCDQARVLSHPSVGCFVTHCGWNSTLERVACGVPIVAAPQYSDQGTNAWLVERALGVGVRATARAEDGVLEAGELRRCVEIATSEAVTSRAASWKEEARVAVADGGGSDRSLMEFVQRIAGGST
ncbi:unnamed protein product [Triticum turgidum subsp. durum]|uniref:Glycosyltransferase n=1 Tax=Triticum turgidum subsp. durum TaxID=4567 RepID=A0A9R0QSD6_TRITD|nr:unnamed protein product [Triticum turgidum subsp. durum]